MASEKEDEVEKMVQPDQTDDPHRNSVQPDMDPGVIDAGEETIDVDAEGEEEEENERKSPGDGNVDVDLLPSTTGAVVQPDVDVIDLEDADMDGDEGEVDEEVSRGEDFLRDDADEDRNGEQEDVEDETKEDVTAQDTKHKDEENFETKQAEEASQNESEKEPDDKQMGQTSASEEMHPPVDTSIVDSDLQKQPVLGLKNKADSGETADLSTVPPAKSEGVTDAGDLQARGEDAEHEDHEPAQALPQDDSHNERVVEDHHQPAEEKVKTAEKVPQPVIQAESRDSTVPQDGADAHGDGVRISEEVADGVAGPMEITADTGVQESEKDSGEKIASQIVSDADAAAPASVINLDDANKAEETEPEIAKGEIPPAVASMKESGAIESSDAKPGVAMDLEDAEEEEHEDAVEEETDHIEDENANADMELSEEEPAHDMRADIEPEPAVNTGHVEMEAVTKVESAHKTSDVLAGDDATREPQELGRLEHVTSMEVDESREEDNASRTPTKESENLNPLGFDEGVNVLESGGTEGGDTKGTKFSSTGTLGVFSADGDKDGDQEMSASTSDKKAIEMVSSETADDLGGSSSANLTAPLFGMRPSGFPAQPVSFRTPPSFKRTSLSPNARPFIPAAHREAMRNAAFRSAQSKDVIASAAFPEEIGKDDAKETPAAVVPDAKENEESKLLFSPQQTAASVQSEAVTVPPEEPVSSPSTSLFADVQPAKPSEEQKDVESAEAREPAPAAPAPQPPLPTKDSKLLSARKAPALKVKKDSIVKPSSKSQGKKVTFSINDTKAAVPTEPQAAPTHPESSRGSNESGQEGRLEEQKLKEEKNDDGFMYEVSHVPLSVRIGNGNVIKRGSLSTVRLTVAKNGEAKLDMFKEGASSLLLFESLSASRNILRVRRVSNRPIMTVTLMSNNNGGTQVAKKYYVHLGHHLHEKVFKACVAHLNSTSPDRRTGTEPSASATPVTKRMSTPVGSDGEDVQASGTKRSADGSKSADPKRFKLVDRRRQLLEAKAKLLENLKAARKNKASTGTGETNRGPDKPLPAAPNLSGTPTLKSAAKPPTGHIVPKTPLQKASKAGAPKSAIAFGTTVSEKSLDPSSQKAKPLETVVHTPAALSEKRKQFLEKHVRPGKQKEVSEDKTESPRDGGAAKEGGLLPPPSSSLKRKKPAGSLSVQKHSQGKRSFDEVKATDSKRLRTSNEKSASVVGTPSATQEKLKALREQAKTGMSVSTKSRTTTNVASTPKAQPMRPSLEGMEEMKQVKAMLTNLEKDKYEAAKQAAAAEQEKKRILEELGKLNKALSKANGETSDSKKEVARLTEQHNAAEKRLTDTVAALEKSREEQKELWTKLSDMLIMVKGAQNGETNDEGNEEKKKVSLSRCDHDNVEDFFYRLRTFRPSTWPVEEADIGAVACARHGWYNSGVNELKSSDGVTLVLGDLFADCESYMTRIEEMKTALVQKHALLSGWRGKQCAGDIGRGLLSREVLMKNASELKTHSAMKRVRGFSETSKNLCELAAACGWKRCETGVQCEWCGVVVGEELHLKESHYQFCMLFREEMEVRRNAELLGLDWEVEGARLGWFFRSTYGDGADAMDQG